MKFPKLPRLKLKLPSLRRSSSSRSRSPQSAKSFRQPVYHLKPRKELRRSKVKTKFNFRQWFKFRRIHGNKLNIVKWILVSGAALAGVGCGLYFLFMPSQIICQANGASCPEAISRALISYQSQPVFLYYTNLETQLQDLFPQIISVTTGFNTSRQLSLTLDIDQPQVAVTSERLSSKQQYFLVNTDGYVIYRASQTDLPIVHLLNISDLPGEQLPASSTRAVKIIANLQMLGHRFTAHETSSNVLTVEFTNQPRTVIFALDDTRTVNQLVSTLQLILSQTKMDSEPAKIDLRFSKPIIGKEVPPEELIDPESDQVASEAAEIQPE